MAQKYLAVGCLLMLQIGLLPNLCTGVGPAEEIVSQLAAGRKKLQAGDVTIRGVERKSTFGDKQAVSTRVINERMRFDLVKYRLWHEIVDAEANRPEESEATRTIHVYGKDGTYRKPVFSQNSIGIGKPGIPNSFWDVRVFGLCTYDDLLHFTKLGEYEHVFREAARDGTFTIKARDDKGLVVAEYLNISNPKTPDRLDVRRRIWIDPAKDHAPVRTEQQFATAGSDPADENAWELPAAISTVTWKKHESGVWVAEAATVTLITGESLDYGMRIEYDLTLDWHAVNQPLDESTYSLEMLDQPAGSHEIYDFSVNRSAPKHVRGPSFIIGRFKDVPEDARPLVPKVD